MKPWFFFLLLAIFALLCIIFTVLFSQAKNAELTAKLTELEDKLAAIHTAPPSDTPVDTAEPDKRWIVVTDYIEDTAGSDISGALQQLIDEHPNSTIYFPDGVYLIENPICTPADPTKSVDLQLSNYAIIRAGDSWTSSEAMIRLGGKAPQNDIFTPGSVYSFTGGIVDGNGLANGISIESGRETVIKDVSIKGTVVGIHIHHGANSGSSDADISNVNIVGRGGDDSIGVKIEGYDNTLTNMRIANVHYGVQLLGGGNMLRNIHPLYIKTSNYPKSCGFYDAAGGNFYDYCYSDQFCVGFYIADGAVNLYESCFCFWYNGSFGSETAMLADGKFNSLVSSLRVGFHPDSTDNKILAVSGGGGGNGSIEYVLVNASKLTGTAHEGYLTGKLIEY